MRWSLLWLAVVVSVVCGCRQQDVREAVLVVPGLTESNRAAVVSCVRQNGVVKGSVRVDLGAKRISLRYDSMVLGLKNLEVPVLELGLEVNGIKPGWKAR
ncbi:MAG: hypothetical protein ACI4QD_00335 [Kiritimatiellia bacterium]